MDAMVGFDFHTAAHAPMHLNWYPIRTDFCAAAIFFSAEMLDFSAANPRFQGGRGG
jgi:hypothetical protein